MSWESGESDKQAGEACLPCIARHRGVGDRIGLRLDWEIFCCCFIQRRVRIEDKF